MDFDASKIIDFLLGLLVVITGGFVKSVRDDNKAQDTKIDGVESRLHQTEILVAGEYLKREEFKEEMKDLRAEINDNFNRLHARLNAEN